MHGQASAREDKHASSADQGSKAPRLPHAVLSAAFDGSTPRVAAWLDAGGSVDAQYAGGMTLLMQASGAGHAKLAAELIRRGASVDEADHYGRTALACAVATGHDPDTVRVLVSAGAQTELIAPAMLAVARMTNPGCACVLEEALALTRRRLTAFWNAAAAEERDGRNANGSKVWTGR